MSAEKKDTSGNLLSELKPVPGSRHRRKRVGRGEASGWGKTSGKGQKGQKARSGAPIRPGFEGGQMPIMRRLPKFGFYSRNRKVYNEMSLEVLSRVEGDVIDCAALVAAGLVKQTQDGVAVLGGGEWSRKVVLRVQKISGPARAKVEQAGGTIELVTLAGAPIKPKAENKKVRKARRRNELRPAH